MRRVKSIPFILFSCFSLLILDSCQQVTNKTLSVDQTPMEFSTLQSYSTPISIFEYQDQVTDGSLLLTIKPLSNKCFKATDSLEIELTFSNLTDNLLMIPADFSMAVSRKGEGGNLIPFITTLDGTDILSLADYQIVDIFSTPSRIYKEIPANEDIESFIEFSFPQDLVVNRTPDSYDLATPSPGEYLLRIIYSEYYRNDKIWHGMIGSNTLRICIKD